MELAAYSSTHASAYLYSSSLDHMLPTQPTKVICEADNIFMMTAMASYGRMAASLVAYYGISAVPVLVLKWKGINFTCIVSGDNGQPTQIFYCE